MNNQNLSANKVGGCTLLPACLVDGIHLPGCASRSQEGSGGPDVRLVSYVILADIIVIFLLNISKHSLEFLY